MSRAQRALADHYLGRLRRLLRVRRDFANHLNELGIQMVEAGILGCLNEIEDAGAGREADQIMKVLRCS